MSILKFLGRGNAFNPIEGNTAAYIKNDDTLFLIDCGETVFQKIISLNLLEGVTKINIAITHMHSDHIGSLPTLLFYAYFVKSIVVNIYYPEADKIREFLDINCPHISNNKIDGCDYKIIQSVENKHYNICKDLIITFEKTEHVSYMNSYCLYITYIDNQGDYIKIFYSGDTSEIKFTKQLEILNEVYIDCSFHDYPNNPHLSLEKLSNGIIRDLDKRNICLMHIDSTLSDLNIAVIDGFKIVQVEGN